MKPTYKTLILAPALLALAACSSDEPAEGQALPEGKYPMEFSLSFAPQTRVAADGMGCTWEDGDKVTIKVTQNGLEDTTIATLDANGKIVSCNPEVYWKSTSPATVTAYYTNLDGTSSENYTDQSQGLAYVMCGSTSTDFGRVVHLTLQHQLAQVRLKISGFRADDFGDVKFYGYHEYTIDEDYVVSTTPGSGRGYITMHRDENLGCYIANVAPGHITSDDNYKLFTFSFAENPELVFNNELKAGQVYTFGLESVNATTKINGQAAILMRKASGTPGTANYLPALYIATRNLGAGTSYEAGLYFWWGDTQGHPANSEFNFSSTNPEIKRYSTAKEYYNAGMITSEDLEVAVLTPEYDAATKQLGSPWRIMTHAETRWLLANTDTKYYATDAATGRIGYMIMTSKDTGNSIILPYCGYCFQYRTLTIGKELYYWESQLFKNFTSLDGWRLERYLDHLIDEGWTGVFYGFQIRPVATMPS